MKLAARWIVTRPLTIGTRAGLVCLVMLAGSVSAAVAAEPAAKAPVPVETAVVKYDDLDLSTDQGIRTLYERVSAAAHRVCAISTSTHVVDRQVAQDDCFRDAMANAVRQLGGGRLAALHEQRSRTGGE